MSSEVKPNSKTGEIQFRGHCTWGNNQNQKFYSEVKYRSTEKYNAMACELGNLESAVNFSHVKKKMRGLR